MFGAEMAAVRREKDLPQRYIAHTLGCSVSCVAEWERGRNTPPIDKLIRLGDIFDSHRFDCALAYFITNGRLGLVAPVNGGATGAMFALEHEVRDLLAKMEQVRLSFCLVAARPCPETIRALRKEIRDCRVLADTAEVQCELLEPMSATALAREYEESRPHYAAKQNRPWQRAVA